MYAYCIQSLQKSAGASRLTCGGPVGVANFTDLSKRVDPGVKVRDRRDVNNNEGNMPRPRIEEDQESTLDVDARFHSIVTRVLTTPPKGGEKKVTTPRKKRSKSAALQTKTTTQRRG
jgi:hypothetical protein